MHKSLYNVLLILTKFFSFKDFLIKDSNMFTPSISPLKCVYLLHES